MADFISIKGKTYAPVAMRVQKFREDKGEAWAIVTTLLHLDELKAVMRAEIINQDGRVIATGTGSALLGKSTVYAGREIEKAETSAVGRALAFLGYGTDDLLKDDTEDNHLADSPTERAPQRPQPRPADEGGNFMDTPSQANELTFNYVSQQATGKGEPFKTYQSQDGVKVNVFKSQRSLFKGLSDTDGIPMQFVGNVARDKTGQYWNLIEVVSF